MTPEENAIVEPTNENQPTDTSGLAEYLSPEMLQGIGLGEEGIKGISDAAMSDDGKEKTPPKVEDHEHTLTSEKILESLETDTDTKAEVDADADVTPDDESKEDGKGESSPEEFEITHNGEKLKYSRDELIELAQKGTDYTLKTQNLSSERKEFDTEREESDKELQAAVDQLETKYQEHEDDLRLKKQWDYTVDLIKQEDPDLFERISDYHTGAKKHLENPAIQQIQQQMAEMQKQNQELKTAADGKKTSDTFTQDLAAVKISAGKQAEKLGLTPNWDKVKEAYDKSGEITVDQAFHAVHGADIVKLYASKGKITKAKDIAAKSKAPSTSVRSGSTAASKIDIDKLDYNSLSNRILDGSLTY